MRKSLVATLVALFALSSTQFSQAIYGGDLALGDARVAGMISKEQNTRGTSCTLSLLTPQIAIGAAHCIDPPGTPHNGTPFESTFEPFQPTWISVPGVDVKVDDINSRVKIIKGYITKGYNNVFPCTPAACTQVDDMVFWVLEKPLVANYIMNIATEKEVNALKNSGGAITHIGYGFQKYKDEPQPADGKPYKIEGIATKFEQKQFNGVNKKIVITQTPMEKSLCPGDSGSPLYSKFDGEEKMFAIQFAGYDGGGYCSTKPWPAGKFPKVQNTLIYPYIDFLRQEPLAATIIANYDAKLAAELKAEVTAKPVATPTPTAKTVVPKRITITCVKGKTSKKVTDVNPKCPGGYKKK
jgi:V8-like Glu-specific endopeptidase